MPILHKTDFVAITGDFGRSRCADNLKRWIESNGGRFCAKVEEGVTHLICTMEHWTKKTSNVQKALEIKNVKVVSYDWLEDSLTFKRRKNEKAYLLATIEKEQKKLKAKRKIKERKSLKTERKPSKPKKDSFASAFASYLQEAPNDLGPGSKYASKPAIEDYKLYEPSEGLLGTPCVMASIESPVESTQRPSGRTSGAPAETPSLSLARDLMEKGKQEGEQDEFKSSALEALYAFKIKRQKKASGPDDALSARRKKQKMNTLATSTSEIEISRDASTSTRISNPFPFSMKTEKDHAMAAPKKSNMKLSTGPSPTTDKTTSHDEIKRPPKLITDQTPSELDNHHPYVDATGFEYTITLCRINIAENNNERYIVRIYESHTTPRTYAVHVSHIIPRQHRTTELLAPVGTSFESAFKVFRNFFEEKSRRDWNDRLDARVLGADVKALDGGIPFVYVRPKSGAAFGVFHMGKRVVGLSG